MLTETGVGFIHFVNHYRFPLQLLLSELSCYSTWFLSGAKLFLLVTDF